MSFENQLAQYYLEEEEEEEEQEEEEQSLVNDPTTRQQELGSDQSDWNNQTYSQSNCYCQSEQLQLDIHKNELSTNTFEDSLNNLNFSTDDSFCFLTLPEASPSHNQHIKVTSPPLQQDLQIDAHWSSFKSTVQHSTENRMDIEDQLVPQPFDEFTQNCNEYTAQDNHEVVRSPMVEYPFSQQVQPNTQINQSCPSSHSTAQYSTGQPVDMGSQFNYQQQQDYSIDHTNFNSLKVYSPWMSAEQSNEESLWQQQPDQVQYHKNNPKNKAKLKINHNNNKNTKNQILQAFTYERMIPSNLSNLPPYRRRREILSKREQIRKKQQESKNMINFFMDKIKEIAGAQFLIPEGYCSLTNFVKNLVSQNPEVKTQAVKAIKEFLFRFCSRSFIIKKYIKDRDIYPQYMEAFFNLLDYYNSKQFYPESIKSASIKQFLNE